MEARRTLPKGGRGWRVFAVLLAGALAAALLAPDQLAAWAEAHADRPGAPALVAALDAWNAWLSPAARLRTRLHAASREAVETQF